MLLRCAKDMSLDATSIRIFPDDNRTKIEESDSDLEDFFSCRVSFKQTNESTGSYPSGISFTPTNPGIAFLRSSSSYSMIHSLNCYLLSLSFCFFLHICKQIN
jgi:hypothetical protein